MQIPKVRRLPKSKDLSDIMRIQILSLSLFYLCLRIRDLQKHIKQFIDLTKLEAC